MRIVSLLPSATEMVYALGLGSSLVGVTDECDFPPEAAELPVVSRARLTTAGSSPAPGEPSRAPGELPLAPGEVDRLVGESLAAGEPLYSLDTELVRSLRPDLILAQDLCRVCAVPSGDLGEALTRIGWRASVLSLDPTTLEGVLASMVALGRHAGVEHRAVEVTDLLRARIDGITRATAGLARPRTLALEWPDPPFAGGHWVPDMVAAAGGSAVLSTSGAPSARLSWDQVAQESPEVVVVMPCGYRLERAEAEGRALMAHLALAGAASCWAVDASSSFSRPGPRLVDGVAALAAALHPGSVPDPPAGMLARLR